MIQCWPHSWLTMFYTFAIALNALSRFALSANPPALTEIAKSAQSLSASLDSLEVHYSTTRETAPTAGNVHDEWIWMISGPRKLLSLNSEPFGGGVTVPHAWWSFDGEDAYSANVDNKKPSRIAQIIRSEAISELYEVTPIPLHFLGQPLYSTRLLLHELLRGSQATIHGEEIVQGTPCWRVDFGAVTTTGKSPRELTVWLDPQSDYALVKSFLRPIGMTEEEAREKGAKRFALMEVRRFQPVRDEVLRTERQFPLEAVVIGPGGRLRYDFPLIRLNHAIDRTRFIPRPQVGTEMIVREVGKAEMKTIHGGPIAVREKQMEILNAARAAEKQMLSKAALSTPPDARPQTGGWIWWALGLSSGVALAIGGWLFRRQSQA